MTLANTDYWPARDREPESIDAMTLARCVNLLNFLETRYRMTSEDRRVFGMVEKSPLYQTLQSRLPVAMEEHSQKAQRKIARGNPNLIEPTTAPRSKGKTLDELNASAGTGVHPEPAPKSVSTKSWLSTEDVALVLDLTVGVVRSLATTGRIPGAEKVNRKAERGKGGVEWRFPTEEVTLLKERRSDPKRAAQTARAKAGAVKSHEVRAAKRAAEAAPPIIAVLTEIHDSLGAGIQQIAANQQGTLDGAGKLLTEAVKVLGEHIDGKLATLTERVEQIADNTSNQLDRIEELARTSAENSVTKNSKQKGKR